MKGNRVEELSEKWYEFTRYHFHEGHIDVWSGDGANHPVRDNPSKIQINSFHTCVRLNDQEWKSLNHAFPDNGLVLIDKAFRDDVDYTAEEVYNQMELKNNG